MMYIISLYNWVRFVKQLWKCYNLDKMHLRPNNVFGKENYIQQGISAIDYKLYDYESCEFVLHMQIF